MTRGAFREECRGVSRPEHTRILQHVSMLLQHVSMLLQLLQPVTDEKPKQ